MVKLMMSLISVYSGSFWALTSITILTIGVSEKVTVFFNWMNLSLYIFAPIASGLYTGHKLMQEARRRHPAGADEPLLFEDASVARVVRRLQVARTVRAQVVRSLRREKCLACTGSCLTV